MCQSWFWYLRAKIYKTDVRPLSLKCKVCLCNTHSWTQSVYVKKVSKVTPTTWFGPPWNFYDWLKKKDPKTGLYLENYFKVLVKITREENTRTDF